MQVTIFLLDKLILLSLRLVKIEQLLSLTVLREPSSVLLGIFFSKELIISTDGYVLVEEVG